jgi:hypothetical protein
VVLDTDLSKARFSPARAGQLIGGIPNNRLMQIGQAGAPQYILSLDGIRLSGRVGSDAGCDRRCGEPMTVDGTT